MNLVLCPPNMTAPLDGANGRLGDRIHQLPAVRAVTHLGRTCVWPGDDLARAVFRSLPVSYVEADGAHAVLAWARRHAVRRVYCLYAPPKTTPQGREQDCQCVQQCAAVALGLASSATVTQPADLDPVGRVPLWKQLLLAVQPDLERTLDWPRLPFLTPRREDRHWATEFLERRAQGRPVLLLAPLAGAPTTTVPDSWWRELAGRFAHGLLVVPVHHTELGRAFSILGAVPNALILAVNLSRTAALAAGGSVHVIGSDGGRLNLISAARTRPVLALYRRWPASAWALPNVIPRGPDLTPGEALRVVT
jgi:hypothetical protein